MSIRTFSTFRLIRLLEHFRHLVIYVLFGPILQLVSKRTYILHSFQFLKSDNLYSHQQKSTGRGIL